MTTKYASVYERYTVEFIERWSFYSEVKFTRLKAFLSKQMNGNYVSTFLMILNN